MITHFERAEPMQPVSDGRFQWGAAFGAGALAGLILLMVPRGSPWSDLTFFAPVVMGRVIPDTFNFGFLPAAVVHLAVSVLYGLIISRIIAPLHQERAIFAGGVVGLVLYLVNFIAVTVLFSSLRGNEFPVIFTHIVFGLVAAGAYRGLLRRRPVAV
jgi:hypothetical protein